MISWAVWAEAARQPSSITDSFGIKCSGGITTVPKRKISSEGAARDAPTRSPTRLSANPASIEVDKEPEKAARKTNHQSEKCGPKGQGKQREHRLRWLTRNLSSSCREEKDGKPEPVADDVEEKVVKLSPVNSASCPSINAACLISYTNQRNSIISYFVQEDPGFNSKHPYSSS